MFNCTCFFRLRDPRTNSILQPWPRPTCLNCVAQAPVRASWKFRLSRLATSQQLQRQPLGRMAQDFREMLEALGETGRKWDGLWQLVLCFDASKRQQRLTDPG